MLSRPPFSAGVWAHFGSSGCHPKWIEMHEERLEMELRITAGQGGAVFCNL